MRADGDSTMKSRSVDVARKRYWPNPEFVVRVLNNGFVARWHGREQEMESDIDVVMKSFWNAFEAGDADKLGSTHRRGIRDHSRLVACCGDYREHDRPSLPASRFALAFRHPLIT